MIDVSLTEARNRLLRIADEIERDPDAIVRVTRRGHPVLALISARRLDALLETLEILADATTLRRLHRARAEVSAGRTIPWSKARRELGLGR
jgi:prevent-host-death family protein